MRQRPPMPSPLPRARRPICPWFPMVLALATGPAGPVAWAAAGGATKDGAPSAPAAADTVAVEALIPHAALPDPLRLPDGRTVSDAMGWTSRRQEVIKLLQHYVTGTLPPAPRSTRTVEPLTERDGDTVRSRLVLEFSPRFDARLHVEVLAPAGAGPFPVLLVPAGLRSWAVVAVSRGYLACVFDADDVRDDTSTFAGLHPGSDWTLPARRAWAAARCIDYLHTRPDVDRGRIAVAGEGRSCAPALLAAALDERVAAGVLAGPGLGGPVPFRFSTEADGIEGIARLNRRQPDWLNPRLLAFAGRETRLPIDQHHLIACVAPRPLLLSTRTEDPAGPIWAMEQAWRAARSVYGLFKQEDALQLHHRPRGGTAQRSDIEGYIDWIDGCFGRGTPPPTAEPVYPTYADWQRLARERIEPNRFPDPAVTSVLGPLARRPVRTRADWMEQRAGVLSRVSWVLGELPPFPSARSQVLAGPTEPAAPDASIPNPDDVERRVISLGNGLSGELLSPRGATSLQPVPAVIWLPAGPRPTGPWENASEATLPDLWLRGGYALFSFDQIGSGKRVEDARRFYQRHPRASLLGQTVQDIRDAVTTLQQQPILDRHRIYLLGHGVGGLAALHAAAIDERIAGVVCVNGLTPLRSATPDTAQEGAARWSLRFPWLPRLGAFVGHEQRIPYDADELLALCAPRPVALVRSTRYPALSAGELSSSVLRATAVYQALGRPNALQVFEVDEIDGFPAPVARETYRAMRGWQAP